MAPRSLSLAQRLVAMVLGFVLLVWLVTVGVAWFVTQHELNELLDAHLAQNAGLLISGELINEEEDAQVQVLAQAPVLSRKYQARVAFQIWDGERLLARSAAAPDTRLAPGVAPGLSDQIVEGHRWRVFTAEGTNEGRHETVYVGERQSARRDVLLGGLRGTLIPMLLALPLLALAVVWSVRRALRPLHELGATVTARRPQALTPLPEAQAPPEVRPLVESLNGLFERMNEVLDSERRFTADAAHELRTPIAAIRMQAQVALGATDDADRRTALHATVAGCDWAARLVEQLLQLARLESESADPGHLGAPPVPVDLAAIATEQVRALQRQADARGQRVALSRPDEAVQVPISATLLTVLLRNLLDNALRYSPDGAQVSVGVLAPSDGTGASLVVEDGGPGLSDADLQRLGDRFFRVLGSRQTGSGLGWSIVRRLARLHRLDVHVDRSPALGGLRVRVGWPPQGD